MLKRTLTGAVILLITAIFVLLKQISSLFFDAFALMLIYASLFEVIKAYKKAGITGTFKCQWITAGAEYALYIRRVTGYD